MDESFNTRLFFETITLKELGTSLSHALLFVALCKLLSYYSEANFIKQYSVHIKSLTAITLVVHQHIVFKAENKRSNNFIGRVFHDMLLFIMFAIITILYGIFQGNDIALFNLVFLLEIIQAAMVVFGLCMVMEILIALLKRLLKLVRWQIL